MQFGPNSGPPPVANARRGGAPRRGRKHEIPRSEHQRHLDELSKEAERNAQYLARERRALEQLTLERAALEDAQDYEDMHRAPAGPPGAYPGANPRDSYDRHHHVKVYHHDVPGLGGQRPDDGGVRRYPSWDDIADDIGDAGVDERFDHETRFAAETMMPPGHDAQPVHNSRFAAETMHAQRNVNPRPGPGAFPGHSEHHEGEMYRPRTKKSFATGGIDPVDLEHDPRAKRELAMQEAKRAQFRNALDAQIHAKRAMEGRAADAGRNASHANKTRHIDQAHNINRVSNHSSYVTNPYIGGEDSQQILQSPGREFMRGVPRRGVNPGNGEYSSPTARAGGGPSSFYLGGQGFQGRNGVGGPSDGAFRNFADGGGAFVDRRAFDAAEARRVQLVADLDAQVRAKREQKRLTELREELEDAKIERRIQEVIEQERVEQAMKERLLERPGRDGETPAGEYRVANSPRASVGDLRRLGEDNSFGEFPEDDEGDVAPKRAISQAQQAKAKDTRQADQYAADKSRHDDSRLHRVSIEHREDDDALSVDEEVLDDDDDAPGDSPSPKKVVAAKMVVERDLVERELDDDASALTPHRQLARSPDVGARRTAAHRVSPAAPVHAIAALQYADAPGLDAGGSLENFEFSTFNAPGPRNVENSPRASVESFKRVTVANRPPSGRLATPLDVKIERLTRELAGKDVALDAAREEQSRLARERDLAERERDLEQQLHKIRTEIANGGVLGNALVNVAGGGALYAQNELSNRTQEPVNRRSFIGTGIESFIVDSGFVRADAPVGPERAEHADFQGLVPEGYTVDVDALRMVNVDSFQEHGHRVDSVGGTRAPRVAGLQRRQARALALDRARSGKSTNAAPDKQNHLPARAKENVELKPVWGANRGGVKARNSGGNRWS